MKRSNLLTTSNISTEIINLIKETEEFCYIVTPYYKPWPVLEHSLEQAAQKKKRISFIFRYEADSMGRGLNGHIEKLNKGYKFEIRLLENLHSKLYINEKKAIISSMNLYEASQTRNFEIGYLFDSGYEVKQIFKEFIEEELLCVKPNQLYKGWFSEELVKQKEEKNKIIESIKEAGFCVKCGKKISYDKSSNVCHPRIVRCQPCWQLNPFPEEWRERINYCHYCGKPHQGKLTDPLHFECKDKLKSALG